MTPPLSEGQFSCGWIRNRWKHDQWENANQWTTGYSINVPNGQSWLSGLHIDLRMCITCYLNTSCKDIDTNSAISICKFSPQTLLRYSKMYRSCFSISLQIRVIEARPFLQVHKGVYIYLLAAWLCELIMLIYANYVTTSSKGFLFVQWSSIFWHRSAFNAFSSA